MKLELSSLIRDKIPNENAISVADGIAQPFNVSDIIQNLLQYKMQRITIPPTAAIIGNKAFFKLESSPCINSLLISNVTKKKKIAISKSFIQ